MITELNTTEQEKLKQGTLLPLMEAFYTIQGEGYHSGKAAYFIRLGGCDVGCHWCDVKESWDASLHPLTDISSIVGEAKKYPGRAVVVTGGEPMSYDLTLLTTALKDAGIQTFVETSGAYHLSGTWDWICLSPKKTSAPQPEFYEHAHELKVIVFNKDDFKWAEKHKALVHPGCKLFLQPEWSKRDVMTPLIIDYVKENPEWNISLQTHKYMNIP